MGKMIGIDLGTTKSCMAVMVDGLPQVIPNQEGCSATPSIVAFTAKGEPLVGQVAKRQALTKSENTVFAVKRLMGRKVDSPEVKGARESLPFQLVSASNGDVLIQAMDKNYSPVEISSLMLQKLKLAAEDYLRETIDEAVIAVPAHFDDLQRSATETAAINAGFSAITLLADPQAAALAFGPSATGETGQFLAVYDLGGGTFEITILEIADDLFRVRATAGNTYLGGEDFDQQIVNWLMAEFQRETGIDLSQDRMACQRLRGVAERSKCELSDAQQTEITLPLISADASGPKHLVTVLTRKKYEELTGGLLQRTVDLCRCCLADADLKPEEVTEVVLVGGQTRAPKVQEEVRKAFGKEPLLAGHLDEGIALGVAIKAGLMQGTAGDRGAIRRALVARCRDAIGREARMRECQQPTAEEQPTWPTNLPPAVAAFWLRIRARNIETGQGLWLQVGGESYNCFYIEAIEADPSTVEVLTRAPIVGGEFCLLKAAEATSKVGVAVVSQEIREPFAGGTAKLEGPRRWPVHALLRLLGSDLEPDELPPPSRTGVSADTEQMPPEPEPNRLPPGQRTRQRIPDG